MKPKTARRELTRMERKLGQMIHEKGIRYAAYKAKPYMMVLKKDLKNPASARVHKRIRRIVFG